MVCQQARPGNQYTGELIIIRKVLMQYLTNLLRFDMRHTPFRIIDTEADKLFNIKCAALNVKTGGRIDRIDEMDGHIRIVDYKTGNHVPSIKDMSEVTGTAGKHEGYFLQAFLYSYAVLYGDKPQLPVVPALFYPAKAYQEDYNPNLTMNKEVIEDFAAIADEFQQGLTQVIAQIFSPETSFTQTPEEKNCVNCDFKLLCGR